MSQHIKQKRQMSWEVLAIALIFLLPISCHCFHIWWTTPVNVLTRWEYECLWWLMRRLKSSLSVNYEVRENVWVSPWRKKKHRRYQWSWYFLLASVNSYMWLACLSYSGVTSFLFCTVWLHCPFFRICQAQAHDMKMKKAQINPQCLLE